MNELAWKMLGFLYSIYQDKKSLLTAEAHESALRTALEVDGPAVYDTADRLVSLGYIERLMHNAWKLTRQGASAWEARTSQATRAQSRRTTFVEATSLPQLQAQIAQHEADGWTFVSLSVALGPAQEAHEGSAAQVLQDVGATSPRLYVAALQREPPETLKAHQPRLKI